LDAHSPMQKTWDFMAKEQDDLGTKFSMIIILFLPNYN
jgi:hypothetical protein